MTRPARSRGAAVLAPRRAGARARLLVLAPRELHSLLDHAEVRTAVMQGLAERVRSLDANAT